MLIKNQINEEPIVMFFIARGQTERSSRQSDDTFYVAGISRFIARKTNVHLNSLTRSTVGSAGHAPRETYFHIELSLGS